MTCISYTSYLPKTKIVNGKTFVQQIRNEQSAGYSMWVKEFEWRPEWVRTRNEKMYDYIGQYYECWIEIEDGDRMVFKSSTSAAPLISKMVWKDGNWLAWVTTAVCGTMHFTHLVENAEKAQSKTIACCDNGIFCNG